MKKNIAIIGSEGFIGSHLKEKLKLKGNVNLFCFDLKFGQDFSDPLISKRLLEKRKFDVIYLLASFIDLKESYSVPKKYFGNNLAIIDNIKRFSPESHIVFTSTVAVNGESPYGLSKKIGEDLIKTFEKHTIIRLENVWGLGGKGFLSNLKQDMKANIKSKENRYVYRKWQDIDDVTYFLVSLIDKDNQLKEIPFKKASLYSILTKLKINYSTFLDFSDNLYLTENKDLDEFSEEDYIKIKMINKL